MTSDCLPISHLYGRTERSDIRHFVLIPPLRRRIVVLCRTPERVGLTHFVRGFAPNSRKRLFAHIPPLARFTRMSLRDIAIFRFAQNGGEGGIRTTFSRLTDSPAKQGLEVNGYWFRTAEKCSHFRLFESENSISAKSLANLQTRFLLPRVAAVLR